MTSRFVFVTDSHYHPNAEKDFSPPKTLMHSRNPNQRPSDSGSDDTHCPMMYNVIQSNPMMITQLK